MRLAYTRRIYTVLLLWQRMKDSNPHKQSQSLVCYHYTNPLSDLLAAHQSLCYYMQNRAECQALFSLL